MTDTTQQTTEGAILAVQDATTTTAAAPTPAKVRCTLLTKQGKPCTAEGRFERDGKAICATHANRLTAEANKAQLKALAKEAKESQAKPVTPQLPPAAPSQHTGPTPAPTKPTSKTPTRDAKAAKAKEPKAPTKRQLLLAERAKEAAARKAWADAWWAKQHATQGVVLGFRGTP